jgi:hypothetical protein
MTITATPEGVRETYTTTLGYDADVTPVTVHASGNIIVQGHPGTGKTYVLDCLSKQWRSQGADVTEVRSHGWYTLHRNGEVHHLGIGQVTEMLCDLALSLRHSNRSAEPSILILEDLNLTSRTVFEAVQAILNFGRASNLHVVLSTQPIHGLLPPLRKLCATTIYLDPSRDYDVPEGVRERAMARAGVWFDGALPTGPGSFIVAGDRCDVGRVVAEPKEEGR